MFIQHTPVWGPAFLGYKQRRSRRAELSSQEAAWVCRADTVSSPSVTEPALGAGSPRWGMKNLPRRLDLTFSRWLGLPERSLKGGAPRVGVAAARSLTGPCSTPGGGEAGTEAQARSFVVLGSVLPSPELDATHV